MRIREVVLLTAVTFCAALAPAKGEAAISIDVEVAPPPPRVVVVPPPRVGYAWAPGYWRWNGHRHVWVEGRWVRERRGWHWVPAQWVETGPRWHFVPGHWER